MREASLSLHLKPRVKEELEREARLQNISESEVAERAIKVFLDLQAHKRDVIAAAVAEADKGVFISEAAMTRWVESWGTDHELPPPEPDIFPSPPR